MLGVETGRGACVRDGLRWWDVFVRGVRLRGTVHQPSQLMEGAAPMVLALHGGPGVDGAGLRYLFADFPDSIVVVPDQRGHGLSDRATSTTWNLDDWADDVAELVSALDLGRPVVMGTSFGAWVALHAAARHPDMFAGLVMGAMTARLPNVEDGARRMTQLGGSKAGELWRSLHSDPTSETLDQARSVIEPLTASKPALPDLAQVRAERILTPEVNAYFAPRFLDVDLTGDARIVRCPTAVVVGDRDPFTTASLARETYDALPEPKMLNIVLGAAHELVQDAPDELLGSVRWALAAAR